MTLHERVKRVALSLPIVAALLLGLAALAPDPDPSACCRPRVVPVAGAAVADKWR